MLTLEQSSRSHSKVSWTHAWYDLDRGSWWCSSQRHGRLNPRVWSILFGGHRCYHGPGDVPFVTRWSCALWHGPFGASWWSAVVDFPPSSRTDVALQRRMGSTTHGRAVFR